MIKSQNIKMILLDIEGTIAPISFVKEVMYPSALTTLSSLLSSHPTFPPPSIAPYLPAFPSAVQSSSEAFTAHVQALSASDSKDSALKALQGFLWRTGFETGDLRAPLYPDVPRNLTTWKAQGKSLAIFSSGSVEAQKLFLKYTGIEGERREEVKESVDYTGLFTGHFDTMNAGPKLEKTSYQKIVQNLGYTDGVDSVLFLSDNVKEVQAAKLAGLKSFVVERPGNAPLTDEDREKFIVITNFDEIEIDID